MNKILIGIILVVGIATSWCASKQLTYVMQSKQGFNAAYFIMWYQTSFISLSLLYPMITCQNIRSSLAKDKISILRLVSLGFLFFLIWLISNYLAILALQNISGSLVVVIFSASPAFVYLLSNILLNEELQSVKTLAVLFALMGVVCIGASQRNMDGNTLGVVLTIFSSLAAAFYIVLLKKFAGNISLVSATTLLGVIGLINTSFFWPIIPIIRIIGFEDFDWNEIPWGILNLSAATGFFFNAFINIGVGYTYPLFISIGTILGIPANILVDRLIHGIEIGVFQIIGSVLVAIAFVILVFSGGSKLRINNANNIENQEKLISETEIKEFS